MKQLSHEAYGLKMTMGETQTSPDITEQQAPRRNVPVQLRSRSTTRSWTNYLYIVPIFLFILGIMYFAIFYNLYVSTLNWDGLSPESAFIGAQNFVHIFTRDPIFYTTLRNTLIFAILTI